MTYVGSRHVEIEDLIWGAGCVPVPPAEREPMAGITSHAGPVARPLTADVASRSADSTGKQAA